MLSVFFYTTMILFLIVCMFMILLVLIQKGRGGGLASAFGGMGGNTAFGSKTGDVLTWATSVVFGIFLVLGVALNLLANEMHSVRRQGIVATPAAAPVQTPSESTAPDSAAPAPAVPAASQPTPTTQPQSR